MQYRKPYIPDLVQMSALFEGNYSRLMRLIRVMGDQSVMSFQLATEHGYVGRVTLRLIESCKYTDTFELKQVASAGKWINSPHLIVRLYHDANSAEVISRDGRQLSQGVNTYPNQNMHLPDEKTQLNSFLAEWLSFCNSYGCCDTSPFQASKV